MVVERQREYETIYIVRPDVGDAGFAAARERVEGIIDNEGGHLLRFDDWGERRLAYEIKDSSEGRRFERGHYHYYRYLVPAGVVGELERQLSLMDSILKFMTVKLDDNLIPAERTAIPEDEDIATFGPGPDEEE